MVSSKAMKSCNCHPQGLPTSNEGTPLGLTMLTQHLVKYLRLSTYFYLPTHLIIVKARFPNL